MVANYKLHLWIYFCWCKWLNKTKHKVKLFTEPHWVTGFRDRFGNAPSQWETTLQCNVVSHWLGGNGRIDKMIPEASLSESVIYVQGTVAISYRIAVQYPMLILNWISQNLVFAEQPSRLSNQFENSHRAQQWYCRALWKFSKWFDNWSLSYGQVKFLQIKMNSGRISYFATAVSH